MNGKFIGVVIGAVVAIMLVGSFLVPIINEFSEPGTETITVERDGAVWDRMDSIVCDINSESLDIKMSVTTDNTIKVENNGDVVANYPIGDTFVNDSDGILIYSDPYIGPFYTGSGGSFESNSLLEFISNLPTLNSSLKENKILLEIKVISGTSITYSTGYASSSDWLTVTIPDETSWISSFDIVYPCDTGDYSNFNGSWPTDAILPYNGGYIASVYITETVTSDPEPYAYILVVIPTIMLASLLVAVAAVVFKKEY